MSATPTQPIVMVPIHPDLLDLPAEHIKAMLKRLIEQERATR